MTSKVSFQISGMHCVSCALNIDGELEDTNGIVSANTNYARKQTEVAYDPGKIIPEEMIKIIEKTGYDAKLK